MSPNDSKHPVTRSMSKTTVEPDDSTSSTDTKTLASKFKNLSEQIRDFEKQYVTRDRESTRHLNAIEMKLSDQEESHRNQFATIRAEIKSLVSSQTNQAEAGKLRDAEVNGKFVSIETSLADQSSKIEDLTHSQYLQSLNFGERFEKLEDSIATMCKSVQNLCSKMPSTAAQQPDPISLEEATHADKG